MVKFRFVLDGEDIKPPVNWQSIQVLATFDNSSVSANISTEEFEFVNEPAQKIKTYILGGLTGATNGIFEGLPFQIFADDGNAELNVFDGYLDFNTYVELSPVRVKCSIKKTNGLNGFDDRSQANSFGYLEDIGVITNADYVTVKTIAEKLSIESDVAIVTLALFMLSLQIAKAIADINKNILQGAGIGAAAPPVSVPAGATYTTFAMIIDLGYLAVLVIQFIDTMITMVNLLIPPVMDHKGIKLRTLLEKATLYLGFDSYDSPLTELDTLIYLPSKPFNDEPIVKGIPNATDYGYQLAEIFALVNKMTNSKIQIVDGVLIQRSLNDPFWVKTATFEVPDVLDERIKYNNEDFQARTFINFVTDSSDDWTVDNFKGTNYEIVTTPANGGISPTNLMKGLKDVSIPLALGTPKSKLNGLETVFKVVLQVLDSGLQPAINLINTIVPGSVDNSNLAYLITGRIGRLKVSQKNHGVAKLLLLGADGRMPIVTPREFSAKVLYDKYHNYNSFVGNNFGGQRRIFTEKRVPFGFSNFLQCIDNSYFITEDGRTGKVESIKWTLDGDYALLDYWIEEIYTENLKETFIEG